MPILNDRQIDALCFTDPPMIHPFTPGQVRQRDAAKLISHGLSSFGYDVKLAEDFTIFHNANSLIIDPKRFDERCLLKPELLTDEDGCKYVIVPPNSYVLGHTVEYFIIPKDVVVIAVGKSTYARCFAEDTKVMLADGTTPNFTDLIKRAEQGERLFGYSVNDKLDIVISEFFAPRKIGTEEVLEVELDNGEVIECTPDHKFITREGLEIKAEDLKAGDSLFPLYKLMSRGYESIVQPTNWTYSSGHKLADDWNLRNNVYLKEANQHRHHINENKTDNRPVNIVRIDAGEHVREHNLARYEDPDYAERMSEIHKRLYAENIKDPNWVKMWSDRCREAAKALNIGRSYVTRHFKEAVRRFYNSPSWDNNHKVVEIRRKGTVKDVYCLTAPEYGNFALASGVFVNNCGALVNVTPIEPGFEGNVVIEISNATPLPLKVYANEGIAQFMFFQGDPCAVSYADRNGKYQGQTGLTNSRV